jgi:hypothetical protein
MTWNKTMYILKELMEFYKRKQQITDSIKEQIEQFEKDMNVTVKSITFYRVNETNQSKGTIVVGLKVER